jgi:NADH-quinone oxidoreductase subunit L
LLIFIYSLVYMAHDENFTRFFCFLSLFAAAMLGLVIANNLLLVFVCWELVGLASYLLIGFWYHKPSAAAAARKAFITTRIGDLGFFLGMLWLYKETGTLLFYDGGQGCLEKDALARLVGQVTLGGMAVSTAVALLIFCGAIGKSGQVPLHVWLPDAMEGPTPVSALIHAATMVAAGVFLVARVYPLMAAGGAAGQPATALSVVTWIGAVTAVFAALIAVAQSDIKRILAYSTVSQLGYMMIGLGAGGVAVGMFHLITHAFFKALLFLGAGSVIHGCHEEQDIRRLGGLRQFMPLTFATYAVGMMALCGVPLLFSGFWSKDGILEAARQWPASQGPFFLGALGALLTAFYMTRQMCYVFFGRLRAGSQAADGVAATRRHRLNGPSTALSRAAATPEVMAPAPGSRVEAAPHESPAVMTTPLVILAVFAVLLGFLGTPAWPWFQRYLEGGATPFDGPALRHARPIMALSSLLVGLGIGLGWLLYGRRPAQAAGELDPLDRLLPALFTWLRERFYVDEFYRATVVRLTSLAAGLADILDRWVWGGAVVLLTWLTAGLSWLSRLIDEHLVNGGFDFGCRRLARGGRFFSALQDGQVQHYLGMIGLALAALVLWLTWGGGN